MNKDKCQATVWQRFDHRHVQCSRPNGHGKGGAYCKQHAKAHPDDSVTGKTLYRVNLSFSDIDEVVSHSETDSTVTITQVRTLIRNGKYKKREDQAPFTTYTTTEKKQSSRGFFVDTLPEAVDAIRDNYGYLIEKAREVLDTRIGEAGYVNVELIKLLKQEGLWKDEQETEGEPR